MYDLLHRIALTYIPRIGPVQARLLLNHFGTARDIFQASEYQLKKLEGIGEIKARSIKAFKDFSAAEKEIRFIEKMEIETLFLTDAAYPQRLLNCYDPPTLLYYKGQADLNASRMIAVIGTRNSTPYGRQLTEGLIAALATHQVTVVSGLAYGIDAIAHQSALDQQRPTVGVLAHGLDLLYPQQHRRLASAMIAGGGGLLTEFMSGTEPDKHHFPIRNRIVAGLCDATIVIETGVRGGSIITADLANDYHRDVFAFPGRVTDDKSSGCHRLVKNNKAMLITDANDILECMKWTDTEVVRPTRQKRIFVELSAEEQLLVTVLQEKETMHIDELRFRSGLSSSMVAKSVLSLEMQHIVLSRPGKMYSLQ